MPRDRDYDDRDYDRRRPDRRERSRSRHGGLANVLRRTRDVNDMAIAVCEASGDEVMRLPLEVLESTLDVLAQPSRGRNSADFIDAQKKILIAFPPACEKDLSFRRLLSVCDQVCRCGGDRLDPSVAKVRGEVSNDLGEMLAGEICRNPEVGKQMTVGIFCKLCQLPLDWNACGVELAVGTGSLLDKEPFDGVLQCLKAVVKALPAAESVAKKVADMVLPRLAGAQPAEAADALDTLVHGEMKLEDVAIELQYIFDSAPIDACAAVVASLGERNIQGKEFTKCVHLIADAGRRLRKLTPKMLERLMIASTKSQIIYMEALEDIASAVAKGIPEWKVEDTLTLLRNIGRANVDPQNEGVAKLYARANELLSFRLYKKSSQHLIEMVKMTNSVSELGPLCQDAVDELCGFNRLVEVSQHELQELTEALFPLGEECFAFSNVLEVWIAMFNGTTMPKGEPMTEDELAKFAAMLGPRVPERHVSNVWIRFWKAFKRRLGGNSGLTSAGAAVLEESYGAGKWPNFDGKSSFLKATIGEKAYSKIKERLRKLEEKERLEKDQQRAEQGNDEGSYSDSSSGDSRKKKKKKQKVQKNEEQVDEVEGGDLSLPLAASSGTLMKVRALLKSKAKVDQLMPSGLSALHLASKRGAQDICACLLKAGAQVNLPGADGSTALHMAASQGSTEVCRTLMDANAEVNVQNEKGETPLHLAATGERAPVCALLLNAKASASIKDGKGNTPVDIMNQKAEEKKKAEAEDEERRRQQRERRSKIIEETRKAKDGEREKQKAEEEKRRIMRERRKQIKKSDAIELEEEDDDDVVVDDAVLVQPVPIVADEIPLQTVELE